MNQQFLTNQEQSCGINMHVAWGRSTTAVRKAEENEENIKELYCRILCGLYLSPLILCSYLNKKSIKKKSMLNSYPAQ